MLTPSDDDAMHWSNMTMMMTMAIHPQIVLPALLSVDINTFLLNIYCSITYVQYAHISYYCIISLNLLGPCHWEDILNIDLSNLYIRKLSYPILLQFNFMLFNEKLSSSI